MTCPAGIRSLICSACSTKAPDFSIPTISGATRSRWEHQLLRSRRCSWKRRFSGASGAEQRQRTVGDKEGMPQNMRRCIREEVHVTQGHQTFGGGHHASHRREVRALDVVLLMRSQHIGQIEALVARRARTAVRPHGKGVLVRCLHGTAWTYPKRDPNRWSRTRPVQGEKAVLKRHVRT